MSGPTTVAGGCICCWRWRPVLRRWKLRLWVDEWDPEKQMARIWLCEQCRDIPRDELAERVRWNLEHLDLLPDLENEPNFYDRPTKPHLRVVTSDGE
jgi:hypothetical protein